MGTAYRHRTRSYSVVGVSLLRVFVTGEARRIYSESRGEGGVLIPAQMTNKRRKQTGCYLPFIHLLN